MNPRAIGAAQLIVCNRLIEPRRGWTQHPAVIEYKIGAIQKCHARLARFYTLKCSAHCGDYVLKSGKLLGRARNSEETLRDAA